MRSMNSKSQGISAEERKAISDREANEFAEKVQLTREAERRMRSARTGGRRLLLTGSILGTDGSKLGAG